MAKIAKVFRLGNSQAVRLPREFHLTVDEVEISREGEATILRPYRTHPDRWRSLRAALERGVSEDFMQDGRLQPANQQRPGLDDACS